jgi:glycosyltransferase involved in cell wall biosynthesis
MLSTANLLSHSPSPILAAQDKQTSGSAAWGWDRPTRSTVSLVIPTLNEALNLPHIIPLIPSFVDEVIVVDGRSSDDTVAVARSIRPDVRIVLETRPGKGWALNAGFQAAKSDVIVMIDADGSMDPAEIVQFVEAIDAGADFVKGSRYLPGGGSSDLTLCRSTGNRVLTSTVNTLFGASYTDLCYGYIAFRRAVLNDVDPRCAGFEVETLMNIRARQAHLKTAEVPSQESDRINGESNLSVWRDGLRIGRAILHARTHRRPTGAAKVPVRIGSL